MITAVLLDFGGVVATMRMAFAGEQTAGPYVAHLADGIVEAIANLRAAGFKVVLVSNNDRAAFAAHFPSVALDDWFDAVVFSSDVGADKPRPPIYQEALRLAGAQAHEAIFLDDLPRNVDAANDLGIEGVVIANIEETVPALRQILAQHGER